jgi:hypothetical protein
MSQDNREAITMTKRTYDLDTAADILNTSKEALRKRIQRGNIEARKDDRGHWQVIIDDLVKEARQDKGQDMSGPLIEQLKTENEFLRQQLHQQNVIIFNLSEGIKLLEPPKHDRQPWYQKMFSGKKGGPED